MASDGRTISIEELIASGAILAHKDGNYGSNYPRVEEFGIEGVPFLTAKSLRNGYVDILGAPRLRDVRANELTFGFVETDDVLLSHNATIGRVAVVPPHKGRLLVGTSLTYFRLNPQKLLPHYLAVYLAGLDFQNQLVAVMSHSTRNQVPVTAQRKLRVVVPALSQQKAIAAILGALDEKVELNRGMNATLEAMVQTLFQSWFVDFGPVRAKLEGRRPLGLNDYTAALFPEELQMSEMGEIPKGWVCGTIGALGKRVLDKVKRQEDWATERLIDLSRMPQRSIALGDWGLGAELTTSVTRFQPKDTLFGAIRPYFHKVGIAPFRGVTNVSVFVIRPIMDFDWTYLATLCASDSTIEFATRVAKGTKMPVVGWEDFASYKIMLPPVELRKAFDNVVAPLYEQITANLHQSRLLADLRDTLLPRLLSGELRVNQQMERAIA